MTLSLHGLLELELELELEEGEEEEEERQEEQEQEEQEQGQDQVQEALWTSLLSWRRRRQAWRRHMQVQEEAERRLPRALGHLCLPSPTQRPYSSLCQTGCCPCAGRSLPPTSAQQAGNCAPSSRKRAI